MRMLFERWREYILKEEILYHGSPEEFDFAKEYGKFDGDTVGAIYFFPDKGGEGLENAKKFADYGGFIYTVKTKPNTNIANLIDFENYGEKENKIKDYIMTTADLSEDRYKDYILCGDGVGGACMFDFLDYNPEFVQFLKKIGVDGLRFIDGLGEGRTDADTDYEVVVLLGTDSIETVNKTESGDDPRYSLDRSTEEGVY